MIKVKHVKTVKPVAPPESGIGSMSFSEEMYSLYEDRQTRRVVIVKDPIGDRTFLPRGIPFENIECIVYFSLVDAGVHVTTEADSDGEQVRRGPGRPPKQPVLA
jgi:hypothetical protein